MTEEIENWKTLTDKLIGASLEVLKAGVVSSENVNKRDPKLVSILLLARTISHARGVRVLLNVGRVLEARILVRNCLENGFWLVRLIDGGDSFVGEMVRDEEKRIALRSQLLFDQQVQLEADVELKLRDWMKARKHWKDNKTLDPKGVAKGGSLEGSYLFYSELSADAHPGLETLNRFYDSNDDLVDMEPQPNPAEVLDTHHYHAYSILTVLVAVNQMLGYGATPLLSQFVEEFQALEKLRI